MPSVLDTARGYVGGGLSVIPVRPDGTKAPAIAWKEYQARLPTDEELIAWFSTSKNGIAVICGAVSGGLEVIDFDSPEAFGAWAAKLNEREPGLLGRFPVVLTPSGGRHLYHRLRGPVEGNRKLAVDDGGKVLIETRGEGGYVLAPGSPLTCHPSGNAYRHLSGPPLTQIPYQKGELEE
jgi:hypothetical protein